MPVSPFTGPREAKAFLVDRLVAAAEREGAPLSAAKRFMLHWSESDPDVDVDATLGAQFQDECSEEEFEAEIGVLAKRAIAHDVQTDTGARALYRAAYETLLEGDHYLCVLVEGALGRKRRWWWPF